MIKDRPKKEVRNYNGNKAGDIINFPLVLRQRHLNATNNDLINAPITAPRIIWKILNDVSFDQFNSKKQLKQLDLFEKDFQTEDGSYATFSFPISDIDQHYNYKSVEEGLKFLEGYQKDWHTSLNSKGKPIKSLGGFIENPKISQGKVTFLMNAYWINQVLKVDSYNAAFLKIPWVLNKSKHVLFYLWLLEVPIKGTLKKFSSLQEAYDYNYKSPKEYVKHVLKPLREKLNLNANISFNYKIEKDNIRIIPYVPGALELPLKKKTVDNQKIIQKVNYWMQRHDISKDDANRIKKIFKADKYSFVLSERAYKNLVKENRINKIVTGDLKGDNFLESFQTEIIKEYRLTSTSKILDKGHPIITK